MGGRQQNDRRGGVTLHSISVPGIQKIVKRIEILHSLLVGVRYEVTPGVLHLFGRNGFPRL